MPFASYLFDLDGTLIDSTELILESFHHTRLHHFGDRLPDAHWVRTFGTPLRDVFGSMARDSEHAARMITTYVDFNMLHHDEKIRPFHGIRPVLEALRSRGSRLAVVTSKIGNHARRGLEVAGLGNLFEFVVGAEDVRCGKPAAEPIRTALTRLNCEPQDAVMVGDSPHDIEASHASGTTAAAIGWGPFAEPVLRKCRPDIWVDRVDQLLEI